MLEADTGTGQAIGDLTAFNKEDMLVIERDNFEGAAARFKKIFLVNLNEVDNNGFLVKREVVDLLSIADPNNIGGQGNGLFDFPFQTIESVIPLSGTPSATAESQGRRTTTNSSSSGWTNHCLLKTANSLPDAASAVHDDMPMVMWVVCLIWNKLP
jgi:Esterase-like activity of phytase